MKRILIPILLITLFSNFALSQNWKRLTFSPTPRYFHSSAIEPTSKQIFMFGGKDSITTFLKDDEWLYETSTDKWTQFNNSIKPSARWGHSMSFISKNKVLLFGGQLQDSTYSDETWTFDLSTKSWQLLNPSNKPSGRAWHSISTLGKNKVILFGGLTFDSTFSNETWIFDLDLNNWELISTKNQPDGKIGTTISTIDSNKVLIFGGKKSNNELSDETWIFNLDSTNWELQNTINNPTARTGHSICSTEDNQILLFGGFDGLNTLNDCWKLNLDNFTWEQIELDNVAMPSEIQGHSLHYISNSKLILLGDDYNHFFFQYWIYDISTKSWEQKNPHIKPIGYWSMCKLRNNQILLFGCDIKNIHSETWIYDLTTEKWEQIYQKSTPSQRTNHKICKLNPDKVILYGGTVAGTEVPLIDTWILDLNTFKWEKLELNYFPNVNYGFSLINKTNNQVLLYGGKSSNGISDKVWIYDYEQNKWSFSSNAFSDKPVGRYFHAMCKIDDNNALLYGGEIKYGDNETNTNELWKYNFTDKIWIKLNPPKQYAEISGHSMEKLNDSCVIINCGDLNASNISIIYNLYQNKLFIPNLKNFPYSINNPLITLLDNGVLWLFNGITKLNANNEVRILNLTDSTWYKQGKNTIPSQKKFVGLSYLNENQALMIGSDGLFIDSYKFSLKNEGEWEEVISENHPSLSNNLMMSDIGDNQSILLEGQDDYGYYSGPFKEGWIFNTNDNNWYRINPNNQPINRNTSIAYLGDDKILLFGGYQSYYTGGKYSTTKYILFEDTWIYDLSDNSWVNLSPIVHPPKLMNFTLCNIGDNKVLLFGGEYDSSGTFRLSNETWIFDLYQNNWVKVNPIDAPSPRYFYSMCSLGNEKVILWGGLNSIGSGIYEDTYLDDTWLFELKKMLWTKIGTKNRPNKRVRQQMCYLGNKTVLLFGGDKLSDYKQVYNYSDPWILELGSFTSIDENSQKVDENIIYPNPSESVIYLKGFDNGDEFTVYNQFGSVILHGIYEGSINIENLNTGVYFIKSYKTNLVYKFIKI